MEGKEKLKKEEKRYGRTLVRNSLSLAGTHRGGQYESNALFVARKIEVNVLKRTL